MITHIDTGCTFLLVFIMWPFRCWRMNRHGSHRSYNSLNTCKSNSFFLSRYINSCPTSTFVKLKLQILHLYTVIAKSPVFLPQTDLEMVTEDLAQKVNRPYLRTPRHKIIRAACLVQQKRQEFLASVARGVAPNDSPEAPRRR